jgi:hypothetical protein
MKKENQQDSLTFNLKYAKNIKIPIIDFLLIIPKGMIDENVGTKLLKLIFSDNGRVDDEHRYDLDIRKTNKCIFYRLKQVGTKLDNYGKIKEQDEMKKSIVLLLESPHKDEFKYNYVKHGEKKQVISNITGNKPANGNTGVLIEKHILGVLVSNLPAESANYRILIVNPIQYQTSLWAIHRKRLNGKYKSLRNKVWEFLWDYETGETKPFQEDFLKRMKCYNPCYILNCCTKDLQFKVSNFLYHQNKILKAEVFEGYHPSVNWNFPERRFLRKIFY